MKVFLDSNVLFSVCYSGLEKSRSAILYEIQKAGLIKLYISNLVHREVLHNLEHKKPAAVNLFRKLMKETIVLPDVTIGISGRTIDALPENDRIILLTAVFHEMDFFLTGNERDFQHLYGKTVVKTKPLTPSDFLHKMF